MRRVPPRHRRCGGFHRASPRCRRPCARCSRPGRHCGHLPPGLGRALGGDGVERDSGPQRRTDAPRPCPPQDLAVRRESRSGVRPDFRDTAWEWTYDPANRHSGCRNCPESKQLHGGVWRCGPFCRAGAEGRELGVVVTTVAAAGGHPSGGRDHLPTLRPRRAGVSAIWVGCRSSQGQTRLELMALRARCQRQVDCGYGAVAIHVRAQGREPGRV